MEDRFPERARLFTERDTNSEKETESPSPSVSPSLPPRSLSDSLSFCFSLSLAVSLARSLPLLPSPSLSLRHLEDECVWKDALAGKREH